MQQQMRYGVIDVGSNSARLMLACQGQDGAVHSLEKTVITCRLAQGLSAQGELSEAAMARTLAAVVELHRKAQAAGAQRIWIFGTAALRQSSNRDEFIRRVHGETSLLLQVLSGEEEARVSFAGPGVHGPHGVIDVGGASTEVALGCGKQLQYTVSLPMGAVRAGELYPPGDIADAFTVQAMHQWALHTLRTGAPELPQRLRDMGAGVPLYGVGGTLTSLAAMDQRLAHYDAQKINGYRLTYNAVERLAVRLGELPLEKRQKMPGLDSARADIILPGAVLVKQLMAYTGVDHIITSDSDNLEGFLAMQL